MGLAEDFTNLGENILGAFNARIDFLGKNIVNTHKLLSDFQKGHKEMGKELRANLAAGEKKRLAEAKKDTAGRKAFVGALVDDVAGFLGNCNKENRAAHQTWGKVTKTMASKRKNVKASIKKAAHTH